MSREDDSQSRDLDERALMEKEVLGTYEPLLDGQIRILHLLPGAEQDVVSCQLVAVDIDSNPTYEALLYAWGSSAQMTKMLINGKPCWRRRNLLECLSRLRHDKDTRNLWVDALCINQADIAEKSAQLIHMTRIYRSATRTLIWLGEDKSYYSPSAYLGKASKDISPPPPPTEHTYSDALNYLNSLAQNEHLPQHWHFFVLSYGLYLIANLGWWSRVWVVQETVLATSARIVLGKFELPWHTAYQGAINIVNHLATCCQYANIPGRYEVNVEEALATCAEVILSFQPIPKGASNELLANLWMFRNRESTDRKDKIYGLLGLLSDSQSIIQPDYSKPFGEVCRYVILTDIRTSGNLNALRGSRERLKDSPSWSNDWNSLGYWAEERSRVLSEMYVQMYRASGSGRPQIKSLAATMQGEEKPAEHYLHIVGRVFEIVEHGTGLLTFKERRHPRGARDLQVIHSSSKIIPELFNDDSYIGGGSVSDAIWRTLLGDCLISHQDSTNPLNSIQFLNEDGGPSLPRRLEANDLRDFPRWHGFGEAAADFLKNGSSTRESPGLLHHLRPSVPTTSRSPDLSDLSDYDPSEDEKLRVIPRPPLRRPRSLQKPYPMLLPPGASWLEELPTKRNIIASIVRATSGRCMFVTEQGYLGVGPESMKTGGSTPFVLRKAHTLTNGQQAWSLVGDCYVHGWMDGEMMRDQDTTEWEDLILV